MSIKRFLIPLVLGIGLISSLLFFPANAAGPEVGFDDLSSVHQNVKAIYYLQEEGVLQGYSDGTFKPDAPINRAEFLKIVMEASDYELGGTNCYPDVTDQWFAQYVCAATREGLVEGYEDGRFRPEQNINFAEASKIVANTLGLDISEMDGTWFKKYVKSLENEYAVPDDINSFDELVTRGQMSEMIWRIDADRTYKLSQSYEGIEAGQLPSDELKSFDSCEQLHDYFEDNSTEPYDYFLDAVSTMEEAPEGALPTVPSMAERGGCFTADTQILMADGSHKSIEKIREGDVVLTRKDPNSPELIKSAVGSTIRHKVDGYLVINNDLEVTPEHVLYVNGEWEIAGHVKVGDYLTNSDGEKVKVKSIKNVDEPAWVFNFEVDDYHTYIANDYYVHNDKGAAQDMSSTNVQVAGVDEADVVKNDGKYIYYLKDRSVRIVEAHPPADMAEVAKIDYNDTEFYPSDMYLDGDRLVVLGDDYIGDYFDDFEEALVEPNYYHRDGSAKVLIYNVDNPANPQEVRKFAVEGDYKESRKIGDTVYMVSSQNNYMWPWLDAETWNEDDLVPLATDNGTLDKLVSCEDIQYMPRALDETNYMIVSAIPLNQYQDVSSEVIMGYSSDVYSSRENMYIAQEKYNWWGWYEEMDTEEETYIHKFSLDGSDIDYKGMNAVPGTVLNQFSMDEYDGNFRVVTTKGDMWNEDNPSTNNLYILNENLNRVGQIEGLAPGERIYSARFVGDRVYVVTFKKVDPLFVINASNPSNPIVLGKLKIPGFSDYLHPYDENHIIGFGMDTVEATEEEEEDWMQDFAWYQGVKIAMFDVTDVSNPIELHKEIIGDRGTNSLLNYDHKALLYSTTKGQDGGALMAFPITVAEIPEEVKNDPNASANTYGDYTFQGAYVYDVSPEIGFQLRGTITNYDETDVFDEYGYYWFGEKDIERIVYLGDYFYTVSQALIKATGMDTMEEVNVLEYAE